MSSFVAQPRTTAVNTAPTTPTQSPSTTQRRLQIDGHEDTFGLHPDTARQSPSAVSPQPLTPLAEAKTPSIERGRPRLPAFNIEDEWPDGSDSASPASPWDDALEQTPTYRDSSLAWSRTFYEMLNAYSPQERTYGAIMEMPRNQLSSDLPNTAILCYQDGHISQDFAASMVSILWDKDLGVPRIGADDVFVMSRDHKSYIFGVTLSRRAADGYVRNRNLKKLPETSAGDKVIAFVNTDGLALGYGVFHESSDTARNCPRLHNLSTTLSTMTATMDSDAVEPLDADPVDLAEAAIVSGDWEALKNVWRRCVILHGEEQSRSWLQDTFNLHKSATPVALASAMHMDGVEIDREFFFAQAVRERRLDLAATFSPAELDSERLLELDEIFIELLDANQCDAADQLLAWLPKILTSQAWIAAYVMARQTNNVALNDWLEERHPSDGLLPACGPPSADTPAARSRRFQQRVLSTYNPWLAVKVMSRLLGQTGTVDEVKAWIKLCSTRNVATLRLPQTYAAPAQSVLAYDVIAEEVCLSRRQELAQIFKQ